VRCVARCSRRAGSSWSPAGGRAARALRPSTGGRRLGLRVRFRVRVRVRVRPIPCPYPRALTPSLTRRCRHSRGSGSSSWHSARPTRWRARRTAPCTHWARACPRAATRESTASSTLVEPSDSAHPPGGTGVLPYRIPDIRLRVGGPNFDRDPTYQMYRVLSLSSIRRRTRRRAAPSRALGTGATAGAMSGACAADHAARDIIIQGRQQCKVSDGFSFLNVLFHCVTGGFSV